jgi:hypothetical protein
MIARSLALSGAVIVAAIAASVSLSSCAGRASRAASGTDPGGGIRPVPATGIAPTAVTLESVRERWNGHRVQIRFPAKLEGDGADRGWMKAPSLPGDPKLFVRLSVSDRQRLGKDGLLSGGEIRAGTYFIVEDWQLKEPQNECGLVLDLRFENVPVKARMEFWNGGLFSPCGERLSDLERVEQVARIELFQLYGPPATAAAPGSPTPQFSIASAVVDPPVAGPGNVIELLVTYFIPYAGEVSELREILRDGRRIASFPAHTPRQPGSYTSSHKVTIKEGTAPGAYTYRVQIDLSGNYQPQSREATAGFEVR